MEYQKAKKILSYLNTAFYKIHSFQATAKKCGISPQLRNISTIPNLKKYTTNSIGN
jgi:hypothetical protein